MYSVRQSFILMLVVMMCSLASGCGGPDAVPQLDQVAMARFESDLREGNLYYTPSFDFVPDDMNAIHLLLAARAIERNPANWVAFGGIGFTIRSGECRSVGLFVTDWPPKDASRIVYRSVSSAGLEGLYYDCGPFATFLALLNESQERANRSAAAHFGQIGGRLQTIVEPDSGEVTVSLSLSSRNITDRMLEGLGGIGDLSSLDLSSTKVTDVAMTKIGRCSKLLTLNLSNTVVSDSGLRALGHLTRLSKLDVRGTLVSKFGVLELSKSLPECVVKF